MTPAAMEKLIQEIFELQEDYIDLTDGISEQRLEPPASKREIARLEATLGHPLPPSYRTFLSLHNGWKEWSGGTRLLSVAEQQKGPYVETIRELRNLAVEFLNGQYGPMRKESPRWMRTVLQEWAIGADLHDTALYILDTSTRRADREMEVARFDDLMEQSRYRSFSEMLRARADVLRQLVKEATPPAPPSGRPVDFSTLWSRNAKHEVVACPCLALTVYLGETDRAHVLAFYSRALDVLRPHLTHYWARPMRQPAKLTPRALDLLPAWLRRPKKSHDYRLRAWAGNLKDVSPWSLEISYTDVPRQRKKKSRDGKPAPPSSLLRVTVPVDAALARPDAWRPWVLGFDILRKGRFLLAESGYSLVTRGDIDDQEFALEACARHVGLDWFTPHQIPYLRRYDPSFDVRARPLRRAAWLTFVREAAIGRIGAKDEIVLHPVARGLGIQVGPRPVVQDPSRPYVSAVQRRVARMLRPVRLGSIPLAFLRGRGGDVARRPRRR